MRLCKFRLCLFFFFSSFPHSHTVSDRRSDNDLMTAYQNNQPPFTNKTHHKLGYIHRTETKHRAKLLVEYRLIHSTQQWFMLRLQHKKSPFSHTTHGNSSRSHHNMAVVVVGPLVPLKIAHQSGKTSRPMRYLAVKLHTKLAVAQQGCLTDVSVRYSFASRCQTML